MRICKTTATAMLAAAVSLNKTDYCLFAKIRTCFHVGAELMW